MNIALSPYAMMMGFVIGEDADGRLILTMPSGEDKRGRPGFIHGGALAGLLEAVAFATLSKALGEEDRPRIKPVTVTVTFMRGATQQLTIARATIERLGRRTANIEAIAWQDDPSKPVAMAQINVMLSHKAA
jgi:uncharacterized protein (TIGR00369 family)